MKHKRPEDLQRAEKKRKTLEPRHKTPPPLNQAKMLKRERLEDLQRAEEERKALEAKDKNPS